MKIASLLFTAFVMLMVLAVLWVGTRFLIEVAAWMLRGFRPRSEVRHGPSGRWKICRNRLCRHANSIQARYCAHCGRMM